MGFAQGTGSTWVPGFVQLRWVQSVYMHLRAPSVDKGVQAALWAIFFFLFLWVGMLAVGVGAGTAFILAALAGLLIFLFVRIFGEEDFSPRATRARRRLP